MIARIIVGIVGTLIGVSMLWKTEGYLRTFGPSEWAERHLGIDGGSRLFYKLIGLAVIFIAWIYAFNWFGNLVNFVFGGFSR
jgi:hypothetical protein